MTPREEWTLETQRLGRRVLVFDSLPSTNDHAAALAHDTANDGLAILADSQTAGRGQHGRTWSAAPGSSVLMSLLLFPPEHLRRAAILTAWAAVAVCGTIRRTIGREAHIKWPNDVLIDSKKVCGILIEQRRGTVAGIGLNVRQTAAEFAAADLPQAASLAQFAPCALDSALIARELLRALDEGYAALLNGDLATLEDRWRNHLGLLGQEVTAECHHGVFHGRLSGLTFAGVVIERPGEPALSMLPEKVLHLSPSPHDRPAAA